MTPDSAAPPIGDTSAHAPPLAEVERELARFGLYRRFDPTGDPDSTEINHIQLIPSGGPVPVVVADATFAPHPTCK